MKELKQKSQRNLSRFETKDQRFSPTAVHALLEDFGKRVLGRRNQLKKIQKMATMTHLDVKNTSNHYSGRFMICRAKQPAYI